MPPERRLLEAIRERAAGRPRLKPQEDRGELPQEGEIRLVRTLSGETQQLALVLRVQPGLNYVEVCLLSNDLDMMSDHDVNLHRAETGLPFDLMAQLDLTAPVYLIQASSVFGRLEPAHLVNEIREASQGDLGRISAGRRGAPIRGPADPRWVLKEAELEILHTLSAECSEDLLEGKTSRRAVIDPALLGPVIDRMEEDPITSMDDLLAIAEAAQGGVASADQIERLLAMAEAGQITDPTVLMAVQPLLEAAISVASPPAPKTDIVFSPGRKAASSRFDSQVNELVAAVTPTCGHLILVVTSSSVWEEGAGPQGAPVAIYRAGSETLYAETLDPRRSHAA